MPRFASIRWPVLALLLGSLVLACGCNTSGEIHINGGTGLIGPKRVKVGETFEVSQPFDPKTGTGWKLSRYDAKLIKPVPQPRLDANDDGSMTRVVRFMGKAPGDAELVFIKREKVIVTPGLPPPKPTEKILKVRIVAE